MDLEGLANAGESKDSDALILQPTFMGIGIDLKKGFKWVKSKLTKKV